VAAGALLVALSSPGQGGAEEEEEEDNEDEKEEEEEEDEEGEEEEEGEESQESEEEEEEEKGEEKEDSGAYRERNSAVINADETFVHWEVEKDCGEAEVSSNAPQSRCKQQVKVKSFKLLENRNSGSCKTRSRSRGFSERQLDLPPVCYNSGSRKKNGDAAGQETSQGKRKRKANGE
jgi:hypothetical protein